MTPENIFNPCLGSRSIADISESRLTDGLKISDVGISVLLRSAICLMAASLETGDRGCLADAIVTIQDVELHVRKRLGGKMTGIHWGAK